MRSSASVKGTGSAGRSAVLVAVGARACGRGSVGIIGLVPATTFALNAHRAPSATRDRHAGAVRVFRQTSACHGRIESTPRAHGPYAPCNAAGARALDPVRIIWVRAIPIRMGVGEGGIRTNESHPTERTVRACVKAASASEEFIAPGTPEYDVSNSECRTIWWVLRNVGISN